MAQGITGVQGPTGVQGLTGVMGITGPDGITGTSPTGVRGETGVRGITGVKGLTGAQGPTGVEGLTGIIGTTGQEPTGEQGRTGVQGLTGTPGLTGVQGVTGAQPAQGITGVRGITGTFGATGAMPTGAQGVVGATGVMGGATGVQGATGIGPTGNQPTGVQGLTGTKGLTGVQGITGEAPTGVLGITGAQGLTGVKGLTGGGLQATGLGGITGADGITGAAGPAGEAPTGIQGITGLRGITGIKGLTGTVGITGVQGMTGNQPTGVQGLTGAAGIATGVQGITGVSTVTGVQGLTGAIPPALNTAYVEQMTTQTANVGDGFIVVATLDQSQFVAGRKYFIFTNALHTFIGAGASATTSLKLVHGSNDFTGSVRSLGRQSTAHYTYSYFTVWQAVAGESVTLQLNALGSSVVGKADQITIFAMEVSERLNEDSDWFFDEVAETTDLSSGAWSGYNNSSITFTPINPGDDWLVMTESNNQGFGTGRNAQSRIHRTGEVESTAPQLSYLPNQFAGGAAVQTNIQTNIRVFSPTAQNTFTEESSEDAAGGSPIRTYSAIFALNLSKFKNHLNAFTEAEVALSTTTSPPTTVQSGTINPTWDGKIWFLSSWVYDNFSAGSDISVQARIQTDGVDSPSGQPYPDDLEDAFSTGEFRPIQFQVFESELSRIHTLTSDGACQGAGGARAGNRQIVAITMDLADPIGGRGATGAQGATPGITGVQGVTGISGGVRFIKSGTIVSVASGDVTPGLPSGFLPNDFAICVIVAHDNVTCTMPAGWTALDPGTSNGVQFRSTSFYRVLQAGDTNPTVTHTGGSNIIANIQTWRNVDPVDPIDVIGTVGANAASTTITAPGITTVNPNTLLVYVGSIDTGSAILAPFSDSLTQAVGQSASSGFGVGLGTANVIRPTPGATGDQTGSTFGAASLNNGQLVSLNQASPVNFVGSGGPTGVRGITGISPSGASPTGAQPTGIKGLTGVQGITGTSPTGAQPTGIKGLTGVQGITGNQPTGAQPTGVKGLTGLQGITGNSPTGASPTGVLGLTGVKGLTGIQGVTGNSPTGASPTGVKGLTGVRGLTGVQGTTGTAPTGLQVTGALGPPGVRGRTGIQGITGFQSTGIQGLTGVQGITGIQGVTGFSPTGFQPTGIQGLTGVDGITGIQGLTGVQGLTGGQIMFDILDWNSAAVAAAAIGSGVDGYAIAARFGSIIDVIMSLEANGTAGTTIVDVLRGTGTLSTTPYAVTFGTIFTTAGNRPMIGATAAATNRSRDSAAPNITAFKKGDTFGISIAQAATAASGLRVELVVQYTGT